MPPPTFSYARCTNVDLSVPDRQTFRVGRRPTRWVPSRLPGQRRMCPVAVRGRPRAGGRRRPAVARNTRSSSTGRGGRPGSTHRRAWWAAQRRGAGWALLAAVGAQAGPPPAPPGGGASPQQGSVQPGRVRRRSYPTASCASRSRADRGRVGRVRGALRQAHHRTGLVPPPLRHRVRPGARLHPLPHARGRPGDEATGCLKSNPAPARAWNSPPSWAGSARSKPSSSTCTTSGRSSPKSNAPRPGSHRSPAS